MSSREWPECDCGLITRRWTSWTDDNPGRRFFGCSQYGKRSHCKFFEWYDPPICPRGAEVILDLRHNQNLEEQLH